MKLSTLFYRIMPFQVVIGLLIYIFTKTTESLKYYLAGGAMTLLIVYLVGTDSKPKKNIKKNEERIKLKNNFNRTFKISENKDGLAFKLIPLIGTNIIKFGMSRNSIREILEKTPELIYGDDLHLPESEDYGFCIVHYEKDINGNEVCTAFEFYNPSKVYLNSKQVMNEEKDTVLRIISKDIKLYKIKKNKIVSIEKELIFLQKKDDTKISKIIIGRKGYVVKNESIINLSHDEDKTRLSNNRPMPILERIIVDDAMFEYKHNVIRLKPDKMRYRQIFTQRDYIEVLQNKNEFFSKPMLESYIYVESTKYLNYELLDIPLGCSRIGGPVIDLPDNTSCPDSLFFMAQINCEDFSEYDNFGLLPKKGFIYFFVDKSREKGKVIYSSNEVYTLKRTKKEHKDIYHFGRLIDNIETESESLSDRFIKKEGGVLRGDQDGTYISKIYGIFSDYHKSLGDTIRTINQLDEKDQVILLQIGEEFIEDGVQTVLINKNKLKALDFENCIFKYSACQK